MPGASCTARPARAWRDSRARSVLVRAIARSPAGCTPGDAAFMTETVLPSRLNAAIGPENPLSCSDRTPKSRSDAAIWVEKAPRRSRQARKSPRRPVAPKHRQDPRDFGVGESKVSGGRREHWEHLFPVCFQRQILFLKTASDAAETWWAILGLKRRPRIGSAGSGHSRLFWSSGVGPTTTGRSRP